MHEAFDTSSEEEKKGQEEGVRRTGSAAAYQLQVLIFYFHLD
jgi:hypothetical protein